MAWNPFSAVASFFGNAVSAVREGIGNTVSAIRETVAPAREEATMPKFVNEAARDERAFGPGSHIGQNVDQAAADFARERGGLAGLDADSRSWLEHPAVSSSFDHYWKSDGVFTAEKVLAGMTNISNVQIKENPDGSIDISYDYEATVDGYEIAGHVGG